MAITPNMGLYAWDRGDDFYDHNQLANNFYALDRHDHTEGRGLPIATAALQDAAVTTPKIADRNVTEPKLADGNVSTRALANAGVTSEKLANQAITTEKVRDRAITPIKMDENIVPLGTVIPWWRPSIAQPIPEGWAIADGRTLSATDPDPALRHGFAGGGTITIPDLRNRFILGAATGGTGTGPGSPPAIGQVGGSNNADLSHAHTVHSHRHQVAAHSHTVNAHSHTVNAHRHQVNAHGHTVNSHTHTVPGHTHPVSEHAHWMRHDHAVNSHSHTIAVAGNHRHTFAGGYSTRQRPYEAHSGPVEGRRQALYAAGFNSGDRDDPAPMDTAGEHTHGGGSTGRDVGTRTDTSGDWTGSSAATANANAAFSTEASSPGTSLEAPFTSYESPGTSVASPDTNTAAPLTSYETPGTTTALTSADIRPNFVGLLFLIKVRHT